MLIQFNFKKQKHAKFRSAVESFHRESQDIDILWLNVLVSVCLEAIWHRSQSLLISLLSVGSCIDNAGYYQYYFQHVSILLTAQL